MLDKTQIITGLLEVMESNLRRQFNANKNASDGAINAESRAETKWDTCGLEASYLARGHALQSKSVGSVTFFIGSIHTYFGASGKLRAVQFVFHKRQMQPWQTIWAVWVLTY